MKVEKQCMSECNGVIQKTNIKTFRCYFIFAVFLGFYAKIKFFVFKFTNIHCPAVFQHQKKQDFNLVEHTGSVGLLSTQEKLV